MVSRGNEFDHVRQSNCFKRQILFSGLVWRSSVNAPFLLHGVLKRGSGYEVRWVSLAANPYAAPVLRRDFTSDLKKDAFNLSKGKNPHI